MTLVHARTIQYSEATSVTEHTSPNVVLMVRLGVGNVWHAAWLSNGRFEEL